MTGGCLKFRDKLSGFVDETLPPKRWDEVAYHLAGCKSCRDEVSELRELRSALNACAPAVDAPPSTLASRLEAIAGEEACQPLYLAQGEACELPSRRRVRRRRVAQTGAAVLVLAVSVAMLAIVMAPQPRRIDNPVATAREQFAMQSTAISVQEAVGAVLLAQDRGATFGATRARRGAVPKAGALPISSGAVDTMMSASSHSQLPLTGVQRVWVTANDGRFLTSDVLINRVPGEGANLVVLDQQGNRFMSSFLPDFQMADVTVPKKWRFFTYPQVARIADREAVIVEARAGENAVARWWFDVETGLTLRSERYDSQGRPTIMVGYERIKMGDAQLPSERNRLITLSRASAGQTRDWCVGFRTCPYTLAGLPLVAYASSEARGEQSMSLVYSDGIQTLTASWTEGRLVDDDDAVEAQAAVGLPTVSAWQAGQGVVSVATNGSRELLANATSELPPRAPYDSGLWPRLVGGMGRLTGLR